MVEDAPIQSNTTCSGYGRELYTTKAIFGRNSQNCGIISAEKACESKDMMTMSYLKQKAILWRHLLTRPRINSYFHGLLRNQILPPHELAELSWRRTRSLLTYAYDRVPYYRRRFDDLGLKPQDIVHPEDYTKVPVLTRQDLQEHF